VAKQLGKMETFLSTTKQVGLLPETLRAQQRQFMVSQLCVCIRAVQNLFFQIWPEPDSAGFLSVDIAEATAGAEFATLLKHHK